MEINKQHRIGSKRDFSCWHLILMMFLGFLTFLYELLETLRFLICFHLSSSFDEVCNFYFILFFIIKAFNKHVERIEVQQQ